MLKKTVVTIILCHFAIGFVSITPAWPGQNISTMITDPGHGGEDVGIVIAQNYKEKDLSLKLSQRLKVLIERNWHIECHLTRYGDHNPSISERVSFANNHQGDLFVSLHFAEPEKAVAGEIMVYYYASPDNVLEESKKVDSPDKHFIPWKGTQINHLNNSILLAEQVRSAFHTSVQEGSPPALGLPLAVLSGINSPAILIEITGMSRARDEGKFKEETWLNLTAAKIVKGLGKYREIAGISEEN